MPAPLVAAAAAKPAGEAVAGVVKVLSTDIVKLEGKVYRRIVRKVPLEKDGKLLFTEKGRVRYAKVESLEPIDISLHANPIGLGVLAVGGAIGAAFLFGRLRIGGLGFDLEIYKGPLADEWDAFLGRRRDRAAAQKVTDCAILESAYLDTKARCDAGDQTSCQAAANYLARGKHLGCAWAG